MATRLLLGSFLVAAMACGGGGKSAPATSDPTTPDPVEPASGDDLDADGSCCCEWAGEEPEGDGPPPPAALASPEECAAEGGECVALGACGE